MLIFLINENQNNVPKRLYVFLGVIIYKNENENA